jgi:tRNA(Ile)-lysidine synthase
MRRPFEQSALRHLMASGMLPAGNRVAVGVSGGADSVALLRLLHAIRDDLGIVIVAAHFDHSLRGAESDEDASFVARLARDLGLSLLREKRDVALEAARNGWNLEDAGRRLRSAFFDRLVEQGMATCVAVAHTADDQAETVMAHIIRGTGTKGLAGIYPAAGAIVRPLLGFRRHELREYLINLGQPWREDSSNADRQRMRAHVRANLLPLLEAEFSSSIVEHLGTLARLAREEGEFWDALVESRFTQVVRRDGESLCIPARALRNPLEGLQLNTTCAVASNGSRFNPFRTLTERMIRRLYKETRGELRELTSAHVEHMIQLLIGEDGGKRVELPDHIVAERTLDEIVFSRVPEAPEHDHETAADSVSYRYQVDRPAGGQATISIRELGTSFRLKVIDWSQRESDTKRENVALDADLVHFPLILRNWRPGDAYRPKGHRDERKMKQMLLASRVPARERLRWPVLESGGRIIWALRMPPSADFLVSSKTRVGLVIEDADVPDVASR